VNLTSSGSVAWTKENCTNTKDQQPFLVVNSIMIDIKNGKDIRLVPGVSSNASNPLLTIPDMAASNLDKYNFIVGINGGYFWRVDVSGVWVDDVCRGKTRAEAEKPASSAHPNYGVGDGLVKINGTIFANNCDCPGYSRPAILKLLGTNSSIEVGQRGDTVSDDISDAISAGPNLVSYNATTGKGYSDIPSDDDNINIYEHAANTAVGLIYEKEKTGKLLVSKMILVTTDGSDECGRLDTSCGLDSNNLATLLLEHFGASQAMSMDQGGSTTMWIKGQAPENNGVVSYSGGGARNVANGLFVELLE
jgi:exopolysaccharide biosynthesis protein